MTAAPELDPRPAAHDDDLTVTTGATTEGAGGDGPGRVRRIGRRIGRVFRSRRRDLTPRRYLAVPALLLLAGALAQRPGKIVADTKVALVLNPAQFLSQALHLWNPVSDSGSIGDQSTGYLVPMGPFFLLTHALGIPAATAERLWLGLLLIVGFWGVVRLADALGLGNRAGRILGGLAYVLAPFVMSRIGDNSALLLGDVMLPWVLLPLVRVSYRRVDLTRNPGDPRPLSARRAAALSGVAVLLIGGINAAVTLSTLIVPAIWLAFMCRGRGAWILRGWWIAAVICATSWWAVSLKLMGSYGINFVQYTESAKTTTSVTSLAETVRGTSDWLGYLRFQQPVLPSAWTYISAPAAIVASFLLVAIGFAGLCRMRVPARRFLLISLALGVFAIGGAYAGTPHGVLSHTWLSALSGPLGAFRNITKFQPLIRLPLALGLANCLPLIAIALRRRRRWLRHSLNGLTALTLAATVVIGAAPLGLSRLYQDGSFAAVPTYWKDATSWLMKASDGTRTLLLPASGFGTYSWGAPGDEPMLWLADTPWAVRNIIPLGGVNSTRWLDGIEQQLEQRATPALAQTLDRAGVGFVLVRNDLPADAPDAPPSTDEIHTALSLSGLQRVAAFGPLVAGRRTAIQAYLHSKATPGRYPSLEIYAVPDATRVDNYPAANLAVLSGGPEALPLLAAGNVLGNRPTVLAADVAAGKSGDAVLPADVKPSAWIDTDTLERRSEQFGSIHSGNSYLLAAGQKAAGQSAAPAMRLDLDPNGHQTTAVVSGIKAVTASNYGFILGPSPTSGPQAAVDGDPTTSWSVSGFPRTGVGQWLQLSFNAPTSVPYVSLSMLAESKKRVRITSLRVTTDAGSQVVKVADTEKPQRISLPAGATRTVRLTIASVTGGGAYKSLFGPGIREVAVPGISISQSVSLPDDATGYFPAGGASTISYLFSRDRADPHSFLNLDVERQISRVFTVPRAASFIATGTAVDRNRTLPRKIKGAIVSLACGTGPVVQIDKTRYATYLRGSRADLTAGQPISLGLCTTTPIKLAAGQHTLRTLPSTSPLYRGTIGIATLSLTTGSTATQPERPVTITKWGDEKREVRVAAGAQSILTIHENFNRSWQATVNGKRLAPIRVDGWQQGFVVPAGAAVTVKLVNGPGEDYRRYLLISAFLVLCLLIGAAWPARRGPRLIAPARRWGPFATRACALIGACATTLLVAGPLVTAAVPVLALVVFTVRRVGPALAIAGVGVAAGVSLAHQATYPSSHQGTFGTVSQVSIALALAVVILCAGQRGKRVAKPVSAPDETESC